MRTLNSYAYEIVDIVLDGQPLTSAVVRGILEAFESEIRKDQAKFTAYDCADKISELPTFAHQNGINRSDAVKCCLKGRVGDEK